MDTSQTKNEKASVLNRHLNHRLRVLNIAREKYGGCFFSRKAKAQGSAESGDCKKHALLLS